MTKKESMQLIGTSVGIPSRLVLCLFGFIGLFFPGFAVWCLLGGVLKVFVKLGFKEGELIMEQLAMEVE